MNRIGSVCLVLLPLTLAAGCLEDAPTPQATVDLPDDRISSAPRSDFVELLNESFVAVMGMVGSTTFQVPEGGGTILLEMVYADGAVLNPSFTVGACDRVSAFGGVAVRYQESEITAYMGGGRLPFDCGVLDAGTHDIFWETEAGYVEGTYVVTLVQ